MAEKHYAFLRDGRVENTLVFEFEDEQLAIRIAQEQGYDKYIWLDEAEVPVRWSTRNSAGEFTPPTETHLQFLGILNTDGPTEHLADTYDEKHDVFVPTGHRYNPFTKEFEEVDNK